MNSTVRHVTAAALTCAALSGAAHEASAQSRLDQPTNVAWRVTRSWDAAAEHEFGEFIHAIGTAVAAHRCHTLAGCLNNPAINPLLEPGTARFRMRADCADVPYMLRAYFAYRKGLPFAYAARVRGRGHDVRYMRDVRPDGSRQWTDFPTPRAMITAIRSDVHSGFFRASATTGVSDYYPIAIVPGSIRPGTVYYDPNGHVLVVYEVRPNGDILLFDGHPDNSVTAKVFNERLAVGTAWMQGGFQNFRPLGFRNGLVVRTPNEMLPDYDQTAQHERNGYAVRGTRTGYHAWVRATLASGALAANWNPSASTAATHQ